MSSYQQLMAQAEELLRKAEELRVQEIQVTVADIRKKMADFGLTIKDIDPSAAAATGPRRSGSAKGTKAKAKFRDQFGNTWSGRGKRPNWLTDQLAKGRKIEDFKIDPL
jgi:DNA-binding protein H-NS